MKSVRLTQEMRLKILARLLHRAYSKRWEELKKDEEAFGLCVYEAVYDPLLRRRMRALPEGFLVQQCGFKVAFGGQQDQVMWKSPLPVSHKHEYDRAASFHASHPLSQLHAELYKRRLVIQQEKDGVKSQVKGVLASCTTLRQLLEVWPEAKPFVQDYLDAGPASVTALALPIKSLNELLGLPPGEPSAVVGEAGGSVPKKQTIKMQLSSTYGKFGPSGGTDARG